jgi:hypothetical protein
MNTEINELVKSIANKAGLIGTDLEDVLEELDESLDITVMGMDIPNELQKLMNQNEGKIINQMTETELKAYRFGVTTCISFLDQMIGIDPFTFQKHGSEVPEETIMGDCLFYVVESEMD